MVLWYYVSHCEIMFTHRISWFLDLVWLLKYCILGWFFSHYEVILDRCNRLHCVCPPYSYIDRDVALLVFCFLVFRNAPVAVWLTNIVTHCFRSVVNRGLPQKFNAIKLSLLIQCWNLFGVIGWFVWLPMSLQWQLHRLTSRIMHSLICPQSKVTSSQLIFLVLSVNEFT